MNRFALTACALIALGALAACDSETDQPAAPLQPVRAELPTHDSGIGNIHYSANIEANTQINATFKVTGYVTSLLQVKDSGSTDRAVQAGDPVAKGAVLATVDSKDIRDSLTQANSQVAAAGANLNKGKQDFDRATSLFNSGSMTAPNYDAAKQEYENAVAQMENARAAQKIAQNNIADFNLTSPLDGVVLQRNVDVGTLASPQVVAFVIADTATVKAVFGVPDSAVQSLKLGDEIRLTTQSLPDRQLTGRISEIAPSADTSSRVFNVKVTPDNSDSLLKVGMIAALNLPKGAPTATLPPLIPLSAVVRAATDPKGYAVFILNDGGDTTTVRLTDVRLGDVHGNRIAVLGGLDEKARVVVNGASFLRDGQQVAVIP